MAAPIVAGIAALVKAQNPTFTGHQIFDRVEETGIDWKCTLTSRGYRIDTTRVDAYCALTNNEECGVEIENVPCPE